MVRREAFSRVLPLFGMFLAMYIKIDRTRDSKICEEAFDYEKGN
ncbi:hypothetical protein SPSIL_058570 [Sporomusa silvacetica DSM 10669]|uniref:Uncharacterized protein n=1 Tax=Sporomusa silvacetica DSM 10669 TaxID=1123289 RepID=A0ABZ3IW03_9FIRM|nr:hypothetical protein SPSIL_44000 [Sporomusa silvacetica DSM 10669]